MKIILVTGVTGSGKSQWALEQASLRQEPIINADSLQFYRPLIVGSNSPTPDEKKRTPHLLFNILDYPQVATAGWFRQQAFEQLNRLQKENHERVFIVGGSFFYLRALISGPWWQDPSPELKSYWLKQLEQVGFLEAYRWIISKDPALKTRIHPNDHYRIERAWVTMNITGQTITQLEAQKKTFPWPWQWVAIQFEKENLKQRLRHRIDRMLEQGLIPEVEHILQQGWDHWHPVQTGAGYAQVLAYLRGQIPDLPTLKERIFQSHWQLVRKQITWLKRCENLTWVKLS